MVFFVRKKPQDIPVSQQITGILLRIGKLEAENITITDKIDKLEIRTRKDKTQRKEEDDKPKGVFLAPDGSLI